MVRGNVDLLRQAGYSQQQINLLPSNAYVGQKVSPASGMTQVIVSGDRNTMQAFAENVGMGNLKRTPGGYIVREYNPEQAPSQVPLSYLNQPQAQQPVPPSGAVVGETVSYLPPEPMVSYLPKKVIPPIFPGFLPIGTKPLTVSDFARAGNIGAEAAVIAGASDAERAAFEARSVQLNYQARMLEAEGKRIQTEVLGKRPEFVTEADVARVESFNRRVESYQNKVSRLESIHPELYQATEFLSKIEPTEPGLRLAAATKAPPVYYEVEPSYSAFEGRQRIEETFAGAFGLPYFAEAAKKEPGTRTKEYIKGISGLGFAPAVAGTEAFSALAAFGFEKLTKEQLIEPAEVYTGQKFPFKKEFIFLAGLAGGWAGHSTLFAMPKALQATKETFFMDVIQPKVYGQFEMVDIGKEGKMTDIWFKGTYKEKVVGKGAKQTLAKALGFETKTPVSMKTELETFGSVMGKPGEIKAFGLETKELQLGEMQVTGLKTKSPVSTKKIIGSEDFGFMEPIVAPKGSALEAIQGKKIFYQLSKEFGIPPNVLGRYMADVPIINKKLPGKVLGSFIDKPSKSLTKQGAAIVLDVEKISASRFSYKKVLGHELVHATEKLRGSLDMAAGLPYKLQPSEIRAFSFGGRSDFSKYLPTAKPGKTYFAGSIKVPSGTIVKTPSTALGIKPSEFEQVKPFLETKKYGGIFKTGKGGFLEIEQFGSLFEQQIRAGMKVVPTSKGDIVLFSSKAKANVAGTAAGQPFSGIIFGEMKAAPSAQKGVLMVGKGQIRGQFFYGGKEIVLGQSGLDYLQKDLAKIPFKWTGATGTIAGAKGVSVGAGTMQSQKTMQAFLARSTRAGEKVTSLVLQVAEKPSAKTINFGGLLSIAGISAKPETKATQTARAKAPAFGFAPETKVVQSLAEPFVVQKQKPETKARTLSFGFEKTVVPSMQTGMETAFVKTGVDFMPSAKVSERIGLGVLPMEKLRETEKLRQVEKTRVFEKLWQPQKMSVFQKVQPMQKVQVMQKLRSFEKLKPLKMIVPPIIPFVPPPGIPKLLWFPTKKITATKTGFGWQVLVRTKGKRKGREWIPGGFAPVGQFVLPREQAIALGAKITRETAKRSFKIVPGFGTPIQMKLPAYRPEQFYQKGRTFIERTKYAIDMPQEFAEITRKGIAAKKTSSFIGFSKKRRGKKNKKHYRR